jgi:hypothetical protein
MINFSNYSNRTSSWDLKTNWKITIQPKIKLF